MKTMMAPAKTLNELNIDITNLIVAHHRAEIAMFGYLRPRNVARAKARIGHLRAQLLNAHKLRDEAARPGPKTARMLFNARLHARQQGALGRYYPVSIEFDALTADGEIRQSLLFECAIHAAQLKGYEVERVETVSAVRQLED